MMFARLILATCILSIPCCGAVYAQTLTYPEAVAKSEQAGIPLLVYFEGESCPPCRMMWNEVLQPMQAAGELDRLAFARVVIEKDPALSEDSKVKTTPTLLGYVRRDGTWVRYRLEKTATRERVRELISKLR